MPKIIQPSFARGEIAPDLYGRVDTRQYQIGLRKARNVTIHQFGGLSNRAGLKFIGPVKDHTQAPRLIPFQFKTTDTHILEFGDQYIRFIRNDGYVTESAVTITGITQANPGVITTSGSHGYSNGDEVALSDIVGMTELNGRRVLVNNVTASTFEIQDQFTGNDIDTSGYTAYTSGGESAKIYEITTNYTQDELRDITYVQTADVVSLAHPNHPPAELSRLAVNNWTLTDINFRPTIDAPSNIDATGGSGGTAGAWKITAISEDGEEESLAGISVDPAPGTITNITQADPGVVTISSHPFDDGDIVEITGVVGMTELNNRRFTVANSDTNTFELLGEDTSGYTAYSSGGTASATHVEHTNDTDVTLSWDSVDGAIRYRIFKLDAGVYGFIASTEATSYVDDDSVTPDLSDTPPRLVEPFISSDNYPRAVGFHQQRRIFGGTNNDPDTSWFSVTGSIDNLSASVPIRASDGFSSTLFSREVNEIRHYVSLNDLLTFTSGSEWRTTTGSDPVFSVETIVQQPQSQWGSSKLPPILLGTTVLFLQDPQAAVRALQFSLEVDGYNTEDLSILVPHLFRGKTMVEWGFGRNPDPIVYIVRDDGEVNVLTYNQEQEIVAWSTFDTDGDFESVAVIRPSISSNVDTPYFVVERRVDGNTVRFVERLDDRVFDEVEDCFFVDSGATYDNPIPISTINSSGDIVITTSSAHGLTDGDIVSIEDIRWEDCFDEFDNEAQPDYLNGGQFEVDSQSSTTLKLKPVPGAVTVSVEQAGYEAEGQVFEGTTPTYLSTTGGLTGGPTSSKTGMMSFWLKASDTGDTITPIWTSEAGSGAGPFNQNFDYNWSDGYVTCELAEAVTNNPSLAFSTRMVDSSIPQDDDWHHILISWSLGSTSVRFWVDDVEVSSTGAVVDITPTWGENSHALNAGVLFNGNINSSLAGDLELADFYLNPAETLDFSIESNRRLFIEEDLCPVDLGSDGSTPTGNSPLVFFTGATATWHTNAGTGGGMTENGAITSTQGPECAASAGSGLQGVPGEDTTAINVDEDGLIQWTGDPDCDSDYIEGGNLRVLVSTITGLHHLRGETVCVLADGWVVDNITVSATGSITLPFAAGRVHAGLCYYSDVETLNPEPFASRGRTIQNQKQKISEVTLRLNRTRGLWVGPTSDNLVELKLRQEEAYNEPTRLFSNDKRLPIPPNWNSNGRIFMRQRDPLPFTLLAIVPDINFGER